MTYLTLRERCAAWEQELATAKHEIECLNHYFAEQQRRWTTEAVWRDAQIERLIADMASRIPGGLSAVEQQAIKDNYFPVIAFAASA